jgi:transglutaminase-like putative cysteine protease
MTPPAAVPGSPALRLAGFATLATVAAIEWVALVSDPPVWRAVLAVLALIAGAGLLATIDASRPRRLPSWALAAAGALGAVAVGLLIVGLPVRLLGPGGWEELGAGVDRGLRGLGNGEFPYDGANDWARLVILLALPLWLGLAASLLFWPARAAIGARHLLALAVVLVAYGIAITANPSGDGAPLLRGSILFCGVAAWLWLPRVGRRGAPVSIALVVVAGALALPLAARLDGGEAWLDYHDWRWGGAREETETFDWEHSYGPMVWSRTDTPVLDVRSDEPHYWRTMVLDDFDGYGWKAVGSSGSALLELPVQAQRGEEALNPHWVHQIGFTVRSLVSPFLVGAGTVLDVEGLAGATATANGVLLPDDDPLREGDGYAVSAYVPDPTAERMRQAPARYPSALDRYTTINVREDPSLNPQPGFSRVVTVPLRGDGPPRTVAPELAGTAYVGVYRLARRLTRGAATAFDATAAIERYLKDNYSYDELPPRRDFPLRAFLFRDRIGYCQQFSGAMALMLRMVGIPSRVAAGFSPGSPTDRRGQYVVTDLDAHSWVEVFFNRIGWVAFDPTPAAAPARSQTLGIGAETVDASSSATVTPPPAKEVPGSPQPTEVGPAGSTDLWLLPGALSLLGAGLLGFVLWRSRSFRRLAPGRATEALLRELESALARTRWPTSGGTTLLSLQQRFSSARMPAAAAYVKALRASRFEAAGPRPPSLRQRRALRRELAARASLDRAARGYLAIPPGGPGVRR